MEFLMTYGWAILVLLAVIGALYLSGVFTPTDRLPTTCTFPSGSGFTCTQIYVNPSAYVSLDVGQGSMDVITVTSIGCGTSANPIMVPLSPAVVINPGGHALVTNSSGFPCSGASPPQFNGYVVLAYTIEGSPLARTVTAKVTAPIRDANPGYVTPLPGEITYLPYTIDSRYNYYLSSNLTTGSNGIIVTGPGNGSTIDCQGHSITGPGNTSSYYGIYVAGADNMTIRNCYVFGFSYGIYLHPSSYSLVTANTVRNNMLAIGVDARSVSGTTTNNNITNNDCSYNQNYGINIYTDAYNTFVSGNNCSNEVTYQGIVNTECYTSTISNNIACVSYSSAIYCAASSQSGSGNKCSAVSCSGVTCSSGCP